jgi:hypothetical protein
MIAIALALILTSNTSITGHLNISQGNTDTLPWKNINNHVYRQKSVSERKIYCCTFCKTRYEIVKVGNKITIISIYKERRNTIHGIIKNGKIYSDDSNEKSSKQQGKIYSLKGNIFRVKNLENGEYDDYVICK